MIQNPPPPRDALDAAIARSSEALFAAQRGDGHWVFELEADATIPAEYVLLRHYLGEPVDSAMEAKIAAYLRRVQSAKHDGWPLYHDGGFDISATIKAYYALKMIGDSPDAPHMARARAAILEAGGAEAGNVFTRIQLALFGAGPWDAVPTIPPELILAPRWFPVHLTKISYWARTVVVPLLVLCALKPRARNPKGVMVDELFSGKPARLSSQADHVHQGWKLFFNALDFVLTKGDRPVAARLAQARHPPVRGMGDRAAQRRGRTRRDLSGDGQLGDDVRRAGLCRGPSAPRHRPQVGRKPAGGQGRRRSIASPASRRSGTRRSPPMPCSKSAARRR